MKYFKSFLREPALTDAMTLALSISVASLHMCFTHSITDNWSTAPHLSTCVSLTASQTTEAQLLISPHVFHSQHHRQLKHSSSSLHLTRLLQTPGALLERYCWFKSSFLLFYKVMLSIDERLKMTSLITTCYLGCVGIRKGLFDISQLKCLYSLWAKYFKTVCVHIVAINID